MGSSDYYLFFIHYSFFFEPYVSKAFLAETAGFEPAGDFSLTDFESAPL